jgi:hypothetical protein
MRTIAGAIVAAVAWLTPGLHVAALRLPTNARYLPSLTASIGTQSLRRAATYSKKEEVRHA